jgi:hypothetical protein
VPPPAGYALGDNLVSFKVPAEIGGQREVTISFPDIAPGTEYLKYTPVQGWHAVGTVDADANTVTLTLTDGDPATDADGTADGVITDPGLLAAPSTALLGLYSPVDMGTKVNVAKAGSTVPVKWRVVRAGVGISNAIDAFVSLGSTLGSCGTGPLDGIETYTGGSGLQYLGDGYWQFNWKTPTAYAGTCRTLVLTTPSGSLTAQFRFK